MATSRKSAAAPDLLTFLSEERPANPSQSQESASDWMTRAATSPSNFLLWLDALGPGGSFGRMSPASFPLDQTMEATTSQPSSPSFSNAGMGSPTGFLTLSMCEHASSLGPSRNGGGVCSLSDILEAGDVPRRFYLTAKACAGILRRAENRGKELPPMLAQALHAVAGLEPTLTLTGD
jgi:hypothetical protein